MTRSAVLALLVMGCLGVSGGSAQAACTQMGEVLKAMQAGNVEAGRQAAASAAPRSNVDCTEEEKQVITGTAGLIRYNEIARDVQAGASMDEFEAELRELAPGATPPWQVHDMLGDIAKSRGDYSTAAADYFMALSIGADKAVTPDWSAPDEAYIRRLHDLGTEMRLAAGDPQLISSRGGCEVSYRGVEIAQKTVPIRFVVEKSEFTPEGEKSAQALAACVKSTGATDITLIGHTDPDGSEAFNQKLSEQRAKAVADYLAANGYAGKMGLLGKGEGEPFQVDDPGAYDKATLFQMHRRVDVVVNASQ